MFAKKPFTNLVIRRMKTRTIPATARWSGAP